MKSPFFWLAFACVLFSGAYAFLHPGPESLQLLKEISIGILVGKYALATAPTSPSK